MYLSVKITIWKCHRSNFTVTYRNHDSCHVHFLLLSCIKKKKTCGEVFRGSACIKIRMFYFVLAQIEFCIAWLHGH